MERKTFLKHLKKHNCVLAREGSNHSLYLNPKNDKKSTVGRHNELSDQMCKVICKQLEIPSI